MANLIDYIMIILIALVPTLESRYAILYAYAKGIPFWQAYSILAGVVILEAILLPILLPYLDFIVIWLDNHHFPLAGRVRRFLFDRARKKGEKIRGKKSIYYELGAFVAIPVPGTGVYTGALIAYLFGLDKKETMKTLIVGGIIAMTINAIISYGIIDLVVGISKL